MTGNNRRQGSKYEQLAAQYLIDKKYVILEMNFRCRIGEIDIVAKKHETIVFVEVKFRSDTKQGYPVEAVNIRKQKKICQVASYYRMIHHLSENCSMRFDVVAILGDKISHYENAFCYNY